MSNPYARGTKGYTVENCGTRPDCCSLHASAPDLLAALDAATAALETVLLHQGRHMTDADLAGRERVVREARAAITRARGAAEGARKAKGE